MTERERISLTPVVEPVPMAIPIPEIRGMRSMFEQFLKRKPKEFHGYTDTALAEHWLMDMERIFRTLPMTDAQKIENASDMLVDEAQNWWIKCVRPRSTDYLGRVQGGIQSSFLSESCSQGEETRV